ncbi:hypothetical protein PLESTF_001790500 [Pleodorina starrii]|nr:hypothetical protein PLESTM_001760000 [Pleodorina starrii]GLC76508.1 hypothetical protein PLESTF_001790500 [Pleodorina starrii]
MSQKTYLHSARGPSAFRQPSRHALAVENVSGLRPCLAPLVAQHQNCACSCRRSAETAGSSQSSSWLANQPSTSQLGGRGVVPHLTASRRQLWRSSIGGERPLAAVACSPFAAAGGSPAAAAPASSAVVDGRTCAPSTSGTVQTVHTAPVQHLRPGPSYPSHTLLARRRHARPGAAAAAAPAAAPPSLDPSEVDELLYTPGEEVPYYMGPLELREVSDAGVGVFVTEDVPCGTLLLACYPLALLRGRPVGQLSRQQPGGAAAPSPLELAHAMEGARMSPLAAAWMLGLYDGSDADDDDEYDEYDSVGGKGSSAAARQRRAQRLRQLRQLFRQPFGDNAAAPADDEDEVEEVGGQDAASPSSPSPSGVRCPLPADAVARVVTFNAYGESRPDPAVAAVRQLPGAVQQCGCVGLWPPFSLINHSCAPVASYGLVGDVMVVRAATDLAAGQQVTISYFGRRALAPLELRRSYLAQHYGFICTCERCTLEAPPEEEEEEEEEAGPRASGEGAGGGGGGGLAARRLPSELPSFLEDLHSTCSRAAAPHLTDLLTGRRWAAAAAAAAAAGGAAGGAAVSKDEPLSDLVDELSELYGYLSEGWQQLLRAAAAAAAAASPPVAAPEDGAAPVAEAAPEAEAEDSGGTGGVGLSQQEVLWLEGSVFVLLDQLVVVLGALGLLQRVQEQHLAEAEAAEAERKGRGGPAAAAAAAAAAAGVKKAGAGAGAKKGTSAAVAAATGRRRKAAAPAAAAAAASGRGKAGRSDGDGAEEVEVVVDGDGGGGAAAAAAAEPLTAAAAMRAVTARRWHVAELPPNVLLPYIDLLAEAQEVATAVAPGSDLAVACSVRLLYGIQAALGPESDEFREAEISCYDALSARYGVLEYDTYEQILEVCSQLYGAAEVRLPGLTGAAAGAGAGAAPPPPPVGAAASAPGGGFALPGGPYVDGGAGGGEGGGMVGLRLPAVPVEAEVVE